MAIPFDGRIKWRRTAPFHVQLELFDLPAAAPVPSDYVAIQGRVVRVFRGQPVIRPGDALSFPLWVCPSGETPTGPAYVHHDALLAATHVEAYLHGTPPRLALAGYEFELLAAPSAEPTLTVEQLEALRPVRRMESAPRSKAWWRFWSRK
jgi:hypothetical protein